MANVRIGTVDIPERVERERYFSQLTYLELSALFTSPLKQTAMAGWAEIAPAGAIGLVAPFVLTHRQVPKSNKLWPNDGRTGDYRDSPLGRAAWAAVKETATTMKAGCIVFKSPALFAPSAANRDVLRAFFTDVVGPEELGEDVQRVWVPDGLWEPRTAAAFAAELGVTVAVDPLVVEPGESTDLYAELDVESLYLRINGLGRSSPLGTEALDDIAALIESYEDTKITVAFDSPARWADAKNLSRLLA